MSTITSPAPKEFTVRGTILGILITLVFTAAQVYLSLTVGIGFATSIPAAIISMALLSFFKDATIQENNFVQTIASASGALAGVVFVLPGLLMVGWWAHVPFWPAFGACAVGGVLGVMYTLPLRRVLVAQSDLPYPEGVAAAQVLKVGMAVRGAASEGEKGLRAVIAGAIAAALFAAAAAVRLVAAKVAIYFRIGVGATGIGASSSLALVGAGHLMGIAVGMAMLAGLLITWGALVPLMTSLTPPAAGIDATGHALSTWAGEVRMIGVGVIGVAALSTLAGLVSPILGGLRSAIDARSAALDGGMTVRTERDLPISVVGLVTLLSMVPAGWLLSNFVHAGPLASLAMPLVLAGVAYILIAGVLAAALCGYMAGLVGTSSSPVSGVAILAVLGAALGAGVIGRNVLGPAAAQALIGFALLVTTVVMAVAVIGNDNLQDLKTGQLVGATPWKQQAGLLIGVIAGSCVVPLVLELLNHSNGYAGAPNLDAISRQPLAAPQAALISTLAKGVIHGGLQANLLGYGALGGGLLVLIDWALRKWSNGRRSLPPLAVGLAIYLPSTVIVPLIVGAAAGHAFNRAVVRRAYGEAAQRLAVLAMSGLIIGESLFNVALAGLVVVSGKSAPLALPLVQSPALGMGAALLAAVFLMWRLYRWSAHQARVSVN